MRTIMTAALALAMGPAFTGAALAHDGRGPAYVTEGAVYDDPCDSPRFTLGGARAGVTVLGVDIDAGAALKIGLHDACGYHHGHAHHRGGYEGGYGGGYDEGMAPPPPQPPVYLPEPAYRGGYGVQGYGANYGYGPVYSQPAYSQPAYAPPCGCMYPGW